MKRSVGDVVLTLGAVVVALIVKFVDPGLHGFYPQCLIHNVTGYRCAGCGVQRALHHLFNLEIAEAYHENQLFVIMVPYLVVTFFLLPLLTEGRRERVRRALLGREVLVVLVMAVVVFVVARNLGAGTD